MARTTITPQNTGTDGLVLSWEAANVDGNAVVNNGRRICLVRNGDTASHSVTQTTGGTVAGLAVADPQTSIPAGDVAVFGPWPMVFNQPDGEVFLDYDAVTSMEVAVVEVA